MVETINRGLVFRIYPNRQQRILISKTLGCSRLVYNYALDFWNTEYELGHKVNYNLCSKELTKLKSTTEYEFLKEVDSTSLQNALKDLEKGFKNFFEKRANYPKFHSKKDDKKSYRSTNNNNSVRVVGNYIRMPKLGDLKAKISRPINGKINNATITLSSTGKYFCTINVTMEVDIPERHDNTSIGLDVGIKDFCIDSNGNKHKNPKFLEHAEKDIIKKQRTLSRRHSWSKRYNKQRKKLAKKYETVVNKKNDYLYKLALDFVRENQTIFVEDLNVKGMVRNHKLAKSICSVSWSKFFNMLEYKAHEYGSEVIKVPRFFASSQTCHVCNTKNPITKNLNVRGFVCTKCGTKLDRDINAAINIKNKGLEILKNR